MTEEHRRPYLEGDIVTDAPSPRLAETMPETKAAYGKLAGNSRFRLLWLSQFVSGIGDWLVIGLLIPLVTEMSGGSSFAVAGIMIAKIIPSLLLGSLTGVLVDRFDRRRLMIACDVVRAVLTIGLVLTPSLWVIYLIVMLMEIASLFFYPAKSALIPYLVDPEDVALANGLSYTTQQASTVIGLTMSGAILAAFEAAVRFVLGQDIPVLGPAIARLAPELLGPRSGVFVDCFTFLLSAVVIGAIAVKARAERAERFDISLLGKDVLDSFRFLGAHKELRGFLTVIGLAILGGGAIISVGPIYVDRVLVRGREVVTSLPLLERLNLAPQSFMIVFLAVGMTAGAAIVPKLAERIRLPALFFGGTSAFGASMLMFSSVSWYWLAAIFAIISGFCIASVQVAGNTYVIHTTADELRGRVFTAMESVIRVGLLTSMVVLGPLGDLVARLARDISERYGLYSGVFRLTGSRVTLQIASLIVIGAAIYASRTLDWRGTRDLPAAVDAPPCEETSDADREQESADE